MTSPAEHAPACRPCGACCLRAFDALDLEADEPFVLIHPDRVSRAFDRLQLHSENGKCPMLLGSGATLDPYRCSDYDHRPNTCRTFELGSRACEEAQAMLETGR